MSLWKLQVCKRRNEETLPGSQTQTARAAPSGGGGHPRCLSHRWPQSLLPSTQFLSRRACSGRGPGMWRQVSPGHSSSLSPVVSQQFFSPKMSCGVCLFLGEVCRLCTGIRRKSWMAKAALVGGRAGPCMESVMAL